MKSYEMIEWEMDELWAESAERKWLEETRAQDHTYQNMKDTYKAMRVYSLYGFDMFERFVKERPHIIGLLECFVTCKTNEDGQCTYACHYYDKEKGCMLDAAK